MRKQAFFALLLTIYINATSSRSLTDKQFNDYSTCAA